MKKKIGTVLDERLIDRARRAADLEGKTLAAFIQEALIAHLARRQAPHGASVAQVKGAFRLSARDLEEVLQAELYEP
ncbi:MAG: hypothetical protein AMXMBFR33_73730 [Candidatus Xenobia bacterium]